MAVSRHSRKGVVRKHVKRHRKGLSRHAQHSVVIKY